MTIIISIISIIISLSIIAFDLLFVIPLRVAMPYEWKGRTCYGTYVVDGFVEYFKEKKFHHLKIVGLDR